MNIKLNKFRNNPKAQTSLVMILIIAVAFIFYAITLNWSRMASLKTTTWMAAVTSASQAASQFASYGERVIKEQLEPLGGLSYNGGDLQYCKRGLFWLQLIFIIIAAIVAAIFAQYWVVGVIVGVLLTAALLIQELVILPSMMAMWNKLYSNMQPVDQFREGALSTGIQQIVNDAVNVPDRFDLNANGKWGFQGSLAKDTVSRFGLFYTERLKSIKPPSDTAYDIFRTAMNNLINQPTPTALPPGSTTSPGLGFSAYCAGNSTTNNQCNQNCTDIADRPRSSNRGTGIGWTYQPPPPIQYVPFECRVSCTNPLTCPPFENTRIFDLLYDPSLENQPNPFDPANPNNSFRFRLGHDDEIGKSLNTNFANNQSIPAAPFYTEPPYNPTIYNPAAPNVPPHVTGTVFPLFNEMTHIDPAINTAAGLRLNQLPGLSAAATGNNALNLRVRNTVSPLTNYKAANNMCAQEQDSAAGIYWKKGSDKYCAGFLDAYSEDYNALLAQNADPNAQHVLFSPSPGSPPNFHYPYELCQYMFPVGGTQAQKCSTFADPIKILWPQDRLDNMVAQLSAFIKFNKKFQAQDKKQLSATLEQWYGELATFIAPKCAPYSNGGIDAYVSNSLNHLASFNTNSLVCNADEHGYMIQWLYDLNNWAPQVNTWLTQSYGTANPAENLCSGTLTNILACWLPYTDYVTELNSCTAAFPVPVTAGVPPTTTYPALTGNCLTVLIRGNSEPTKFFGAVPVAVAGGATSFQTDATTYPLIRAWIFDNKIMKSEVLDTRNHLDKMKTYAQGARQLFQEGADNFRSFLSSGGPVDQVLRAVRDQQSASKRLPSFLIYGWKDKPTQALSSDRWHLARMEVKESNRLPWLRATSSGSFFSKKRCFTFTNGNDDVWVRATRWDQDFTGSTTNFANGVKIWQFKFRDPNPHNQTVVLGDLGSDCVRNGFGVGLTEDTRAALNTIPPALTTTERDDLSQAFMLNIDPNIHVPDDEGSVAVCILDINNCGTLNTYYNCCASYTQGAYQYGYYSQQAWMNFCQSTNLSRCIQNKKNAELRREQTEVRACFQTAGALLNSGVKSAAGARYGVPNQRPWHTGIFFHNADKAGNTQTGPFRNHVTTTYNDQ